MSIERQLRTGGDPRALADYAVLREELSKLTHPARPDVNWKKVEQLSLSLFQQNGIELQTASWYTLARMELVGLPGLNEGLAILEALIARQWPGLWPQPVHSRMEILAGLSQRLQQSLRGLTLEYHDLPQIYQAEKLINALCNVLQRLELKHASHLATLSTFMQGAAMRLENMHAITDSAVELPASVEKAEKEWRAAASEPWVYVAQAEPATPQVVISPGPVTKPPVQWKGFIAGIVVSVLAGSGVIAGVSTFYSPPDSARLMAALQDGPKPLSAAELETLKNRDTQELNRESPQVIAATRQQVRRLATLSPRWAQDIGSQLIRQTRVLWPENPETQKLALEWTKQLNANAVPLEKLNGWNLASGQLQQLADKLNSLDEQRGKYMTVSELKSSIFAIQQTMAKNPPVEESLRQFADAQEKNKISSQQTMQLDSQFTQLLNRYVLLLTNNNY